MADQPDATSADVDTSATGDDDTAAENLLADAVEADEGDPEGADQLGDAGQRALETLKERRRKAAAERDTERSKREQYESFLRGLGVDPGALIKKASEQTSGDVEAVRRDAMAKANTRILRSEVKVAAAGKLADPSDALRLLDLDQFEVSDDGEVDIEEINEAISELIKSKPYLAAATAKRFQGTADGGARNGSPKPSQLSRSDLKSMSADQVNAARKAGQLNELLGIEN